MYRYSTSFFCMWISSVAALFLSFFFWALFLKSFLPAVKTWNPCWKSVDHNWVSIWILTYIPLISMFILCNIGLDYYSFALCFELGNASPPTLFFLGVVLAIQDSLNSTWILRSACQFCKEALIRSVFFFIDQFEYASLFEQY